MFESDDRQAEFDPEGDLMEDGFEDSFEGGFEAGESGESTYELDETSSPLDEADEMRLAAELLDITSEEELDQFLGKVFKKVWGGIKKVAKPLGRVLKGVAKVALPIAGKIAGGFFGGPAGAFIGGQLGGVASKMFGAEIEGLSAEDQSFEVARRFVRLAASSAASAGRMPEGDPVGSAHRAVRQAARRHAPGLLRPSGSRPKPKPRPGRYGAGALQGPIGAIESGRWGRRGRSIVIFNCYSKGA